MIKSSTTIKFLSLLFMAAIIGLMPYGCAIPPQPSIPAPAKPTDTVALKRLDPCDYPHFTDNGNFDALINSIDKSLVYLKKLPAARRITIGADTYRVDHLIRSLETFGSAINNNPSPSQLNQIIRDRFNVYQSTGRSGQNDVLFTGYYEPLLKASRWRNKKFKIPVHSKPKDMVEIDLSRFAADLKGRYIVGQYTGNTVIPYPTRKQIRQKNDFNAIAPPIVWLQDEIDLLILQIQGSGRVILEDGTRLIIQYDGSNGRPYRSIGRLLINQGKITPAKMSMQAIRSYLRKHPQNAHTILDHNPRYIFFRKATRGPLGALGQPLTPMRSIAVDRKVLPSAALAFIVTPLPKVDSRGKIIDWPSYQGFALSQDAGSAIKGPGRIDLFMGHGLVAEIGAGHLKHPGRLYFLVLKP